MDWNRYKDTIQQADKNVQAVVSNGKIDSSSVHFTNTKHVLGRQSRLVETFKRIGGAGRNILAVYLVDKGHSDGMELHWITENAVVIVTNALKDNGLDICTFIPARVGQLTRYPRGGAPGWSVCERMFPDLEWKVPDELVKKAKRNEDIGLNLMEESAHALRNDPCFVCPYCGFNGVDSDSQSEKMKNLNSVGEGFNFRVERHCPMCDHFWDVVLKMHVVTVDGDEELKE